MGYVGLCTAVALANKGYTVLASENNTGKAAQIRQGIPPFHEPGLEPLLNKVIKNNRLEIANQTEDAILETDITFITVGTPSNPDGSINLQHIDSASSDIGKALAKKHTYSIVVVKSTVVPGTTQNNVKKTVEERSKKNCGPDFGLCMNPEFLRQGSALNDTLNPDRIVIGSHDTKSGDLLENLYRAIYSKKQPTYVRTTLSTAELIKYASNSFLATKISFINMIANMCERIPGADSKTVAQAMGLDKRIGPLFLDSGLGYGGSCFPKDTKALIACSKKLEYNPQLLDSVEEINKAQPLRAIELCRELIGNLKGKRIAILGLAFKPNTDDMREARAIPLINGLADEGAEVSSYDPVAMPAAKKIFDYRIEYAASAMECLRNADCCVIVTEWDEFKQLKPEHFISEMRNPAIVDGRRIYDPIEYGKKIKFRAIGLGPREK